jgi:FlaA1/EpsC-like NDP-sugar epimerase
MRTRLFNRTAQLLIDMGALAVCYVLAFYARFEGDVPPHMLRMLAWTLPYVVTLQYGFIVLLRVHKLSWRYIALPDIRRIALAVFGAGVVLIVSRLVGEVLLASHPLVARAVIPIGVTVSGSAFAFLGITGVRVLRRMVAERSETGLRTGPEHEAVKTLLAGAGRAGVLVAKEIAARPDIGMNLLGFVDDDKVKVGTLVHGLGVLGTTEQIPSIAARLGAKQVLITAANASGKEIRRIVNLCEEADLTVKVIPGLFEIVGGKLNLSRIRKVAIDDLLRREPVKLDEDAINEVVRGRVVLITGAGGSIGSELCRQICRFEPKRLVLVENSENNLFQIERELRADHPELAIVACMADIRDARRMEGVFTTEKPAVVFHAAAHKHVPMMEVNPGEAVKNNVLGTKLVAELADRHGVSEMVMISTDKAVNPTSIMGVSKRAAEIFVQALSARSKTKFVAVRFGNVLGSAGSVVPIFQEQIARGGPVMVTDPEMKRYFMTIPEACQLVLQAGTMGASGDIFVLDMGEPVKIVDLARDLIRLSGLREGEDIEIAFSGIRPGEKLFEELSFEEEQAERTRHPKIFIGRLRSLPWQEVVQFVADLTVAAESGDQVAVRRAFRHFIPEYRPNPAGLSVPPPPVSEAAVSDDAPSHNLDAVEVPAAYDRPSKPLVTAEA